MKRYISSALSVFFLLLMVAFICFFFFPEAKGEEGLDYESLSVQHLSNMADDGDNKAQYYLGLSYLNGERGAEKNPDKAYSFFEKSSPASADAEFFMGLMMAYGYGVEKNLSSGITLMEQAGDRGSFRAQKELAEIYAFGELGSDLIDYNKAFGWFLKAANSGDGISMLSVAQFYRDGRGVEKDDEEALGWVLKSVEEDTVSSFDMAGDFYAQGIGTEQDLVRAYMMYDLGGTASSDKKAELEEQMTQEQIDEAVSLSRQWQEDHNSYRPSYHGLEAQGSDGHYEYH